MRVYNGKPLLNSVNGKQEVMDAVFPLVKRYGAVVVALTLDESGIPETADGRIAIAEKIYREAAKYGIGKKDILMHKHGLVQELKREQKVRMSWWNLMLL